MAKFSKDFLDQLPQLEIFLAENTVMQDVGFYGLQERQVIREHIETADLGVYYQKMYPHSSAAACLLSVAIELGVQKIFLFENFRTACAKNDELALDERCETDIYKVISNYQGRYEGNFFKNKRVERFSAN